MDPTRLLLIRHGETRWNIEDRLQGWQDSPLSEAGLAQARRLGEALAGLAPAALIASDAGRAQTTASLIGERLGIRPLSDPRLREISFGRWEGSTHASLPPEVDAERQRIMAMDPACTMALPGGESPAMVSRRAWECLEEAASRHAGKRVLIVTHGGVLACVLRTVLGVPARAPRRFHIGNTALIHLVRSPDGPWMMELDDLDPTTPASRPV